MSPIWKMRATIREIEETTLIANGWEQTQWRWFKAWEKQDGEEHFLCISTDEALTIESALQGNVEGLV